MTTMTAWIRCAALLLLGAAIPAHAQELEPRSYVNTPVGLNFLVAGYGYTAGDVVFSAPIPLDKLYGSTDLYSRTGTEFDALGIAWQVRWGGGL